ncbi:MAG: ATP-grasp domain-containing protein [Lachnospiraceae bacterium]|jgi:biotin carboxylase
MKKLMILGAGIYQVPLILQAKKMGLFTIVVSIDGNYPGFALADRVYKLNTRDLDAVLQAAQREEIDGICTSGTDVAVRTIGYVCQKMGLSGISQRAAEIVTDKRAMKEAFAAHEVSTAAFRTAYSLEEARAAAEALGFPVVLKVVDSSGSRGILRVDHRDELADSYDEVRSYTQKPYILVEQCIEALEIGVDGFVQDGKVELLLPHDKFVYQVNGATVPVGHHFPFRGSQALLDEIRIQMERAVKAVGADHCPVNADVFVKGDKVWIIEMGGRSGATCIPELISMHCGFNYYEKMIRAALGETVSFVTQPLRPCMAKLIFSNQDGVITRVDTEILKELHRQGVTAQIDYEPGSKVCHLHNGTDRIGHVIVPVDDECVLEEMAEKLRRHIWIDHQNLQEIWELS